MRKGESSTEMVGRLAYEGLTGSPPRSAETRRLLSHLVHSTYGALQGGLYGIFRDRAKPPDPAGAAVFGAALWTIGEAGLPLLGLGKGPTARPLEHHAASLGAHLSTRSRWLPPCRHCAACFEGGELGKLAETETLLRRLK